MSVFIRTLLLSAPLAFVSATAADRSPAREAWGHCDAAIKQRLGDEVEMRVTDYAERGTNAFRFTVDVNHETGADGEATCKSHVRRGLLELELDEDLAAIVVEGASS